MWHRDILWSLLRIFVFFFASFHLISLTRRFSLLRKMNYDSFPFFVCFHHFSVLSLIFLTLLKSLNEMTEGISLCIKLETNLWNIFSKIDFFADSKSIKIPLHKTTMLLCWEGLERISIYLRIMTWNHIKILWIVTEKIH